MGCYVEYYLEEKTISFRIEHYHNTGYHYAEYLLSEEDTALLTTSLGFYAPIDTVRYLTEKYSTNDGVFALLNEHSVRPFKKSAGYFDGSADI